MRVVGESPAGTAVGTCQSELCRRRLKLAHRATVFEAPVFSNIANRLRVAILVRSVEVALSRPVVQNTLDVAVESTALNQPPTLSAAKQFFCNAQFVDFRN